MLQLCLYLFIYYIYFKSHLTIVYIYHSNNTIHLSTKRRFLQLLGCPFSLFVGTTLTEVTTLLPCSTPPVSYAPPSGLIHRVLVLRLVAFLFAVLREPASQAFRAICYCCIIRHPGSSSSTTSQLVGAACCLGQRRLFIHTVEVVGSSST